jgi:hypothetical protein
MTDFDREANPETTAYWLARIRKEMTAASGPMVKGATAKGPHHDHPRCRDDIYTLLECARRITRGEGPDPLGQVASRHLAPVDDDEPI